MKDIESSSSVEDFLALVSSLEVEDIIKTLDIIFQTIDELFRKDKFADVDLILKQAPLNLHVSTLIGILTATLPAKNQLSERKAFCQAVREEFVKRGITELEDLLRGLE